MVDGNVPGLENVTYKIQTVYRSFKDENVMLQDAFADIKINELDWFVPAIYPRFYFTKDAAGL
ncbi:MAG: hypothetical protein U5K00_04695 [Melioribacteraceae bacterium]|nr:hypothetical protein [Melioribacteraceae bacterium]